MGWHNYHLFQFTVGKTFYGDPSLDDLKSREKRGMDLKAAAKALHIPQYRLRQIEGCRVTQLKPSVLHAYIDFFGLKEWFARWRKSNRKLAARLAPDAKSKVR